MTEINGSAEGQTSLEENNHPGSGGMNKTRSERSRVSKTPRKRSSDINPGCFSTSVCPEGVSSPACSPAAPEGRVNSAGDVIINTISNIRCEERAVKCGSKRPSDTNPGCFSTSVCPEGVSSPACSPAAPECRAGSGSNAFLNNGNVDGTPSADSTTSCMRSKTGTVFRFTDLSHNFDNPSTNSTSSTGSTGSTEKPKDPKWFPTPKRSRKQDTTVGVAKSPVHLSSTPIPLEKVAELLRSNPALANGGLPADEASLLLPDCYQKAYAECYNKGEQLELKVAGDFVIRDVGQDFASFIPRIDLAACKLREQIFPDVYSAHTALCQMIRSFIPSFTVNVKRTRKNKTNVRMDLECATASHDKGVGETKCPWRAVIVSEDEGVCRICRIDSFELHSEKCFNKSCRNRSDEVSAQVKVPCNIRPSIMREIGQGAVDQNTVAQRDRRSLKQLTYLLNNKRDEKIKNQEIDWSVTNLRETESTPIPDETKVILRYLTLIQNGDKANTFFEVDPSDSSTVTISLIWPLGADLLGSHSDVIFCDSAWESTDQRDSLLTMVVIDKDYKLRLAAAAITTHECLLSWKMFFTFVKRCVPKFCPECFVSDDASYIHNAFKQCINPKVVDIICWWHKSKTIKDKTGLVKYYGMRILSQAYANKTEEAESEFDKLSEEISKRKMDDVSKKYLLSLLENRRHQIFIKLTVFTGGTLCNSNAESINSRLRSYGINEKTERIEIISILRQHCPDVPKNFKPITAAAAGELLNIMTEEVIEKISTGVLIRERMVMRQVKENCTVSSAAGQLIKIQEQVNIVNEYGTHLSRFVAWDVTWNIASGRPHCSCNALVHAGVPCNHIILAALHTGFKIPLSCFNTRFFDEKKVPIRLRLHIPISHAPTLDIQTSDEHHLERELQAAELTTTSPAVDTSKAIEDEQHITEMWHACKHNDELSLKTLGYTRALETDVLRLVHARKTVEEVEEVFGMIDHLHKMVAELLAREERLNPTFGTMEHARSTTNRITWRNYGSKVAAERDRRLSELHEIMKSPQRGTITATVPPAAAAAAAAAAATTEETTVHSQ